MLTVRKAADRGRTRTHWLDSAHSFAFGGYRDPHHLGFRGLRVLNEDRVTPGSGFAPHAHAEMEILTYGMRGALAHRDDAGHQGVIRAGDLQHMSAGTGIVHSERNASDSEPAHFFQIWLLPDRAGLAPGYAQRAFGDGATGLLRLADGEGRDGSLRIHAAVSLHRGRFGAGDRHALRLAPGRHGWLQLVEGSLAADGIALAAGDGLAVSDFTALAIEAREPVEFLWFDLA